MYARNQLSIFNFHYSIKLDNFADVKRDLSTLAATAAIIILLAEGCGVLSSLAERTGLRIDRTCQEEEIDWGTPSRGNIELKEKEEPHEESPAQPDIKEESKAEEESEAEENIEKEEESQDTVPYTKREVLTATQNNLLRTARSKIGCKYAYAGDGPETFDCSGLMLYVFAKEGINLPHGSAAQYSCGKPLKKGDVLKPGDLVFFSGRKISATVGHVGMVTSYDEKTQEFKFIHAAMTGVEEQVSTAEYYALRFIGARRILPEEN